MEDRIIDLETRLAHYERLADDISDVLTRQGQAIDLLTRQVMRLQARLDELEWAGSPPDDRPPPHY